MENIIKVQDKFFDSLRRHTKDYVLLFVRVYVGWAFLQAGYNKFTTWDSTLYLFESEYIVPLLPYESAAYLATGIELIIPILLIIGIETAGMALILFTFNLVAVMSYPVLWETGYYDHKLWGLMLLISVYWGHGRLSVDHYLVKNYHSKHKKRHLERTE